MCEFVSPPRLKGILKLFPLVALFLLHFPMTNAASPQDGDAPVLFDIREKPPRPDVSTLVRLRFLTTVDFPPFNFTDQTGRLAGFHVDLAREICTELKIETHCQIQAMPFDELEKALESKQGDAVAAGVAITASLRDGFAFSRPYIGMPARFLRNTAAAIDGNDASALAGRRVGVVASTAHEAMLRSFFPDIDAVAFDGPQAMLDALKGQQVDAVFADGLRLSFWAASDTANRCCTLFDGPYVSERFLGEGFTIMTRREDTILMQAIDYALSNMSRNGRLREIYLKYFPYGLY